MNQVAYIPAHAVYAPSSAHRWMECTASASAIAALPAQVEGEEAADGTRAHDEIERILGEFNDGRPSTDRHAYVPDQKHPAAYGVALVLDYVRQLPPGRLWVEQRVQLTPQIWGRCDVAHWEPISRVLTIIDYKNGYVNVEAERNEQLRIYAAGSIFTHNLPALWIRYVVVQPNSFMPVPRVKQWIESAADLYGFAERAAAVPTGKLEFKAGEHCRDCPLFGMCDPTKDILKHLAIMLLRPATEVTAAQMAPFQAAWKPIEHWFEALDKHGLKMALAGNVPAGMKVVTTTTKRAWKDVDAARAAVLAKCGVAALDPPTPAQAEKLGIDVSTLASALPGGPTLAFESDKRPAWVRPTAAEMFKVALEAERAKDAA